MRAERVGRAATSGTSAASRRAVMLGVLAVATTIGACKSDGDAVIGDSSTIPGGGEAPGPGGGAGVPSEGGSATGPGTGGPGEEQPAGPLPTPTFKALVQRCKLISNRNLDEPTA